MSTSQITHKPDKDKSLWVLGDLYTFKVVNEGTSGNYSVVEILAQPNNGPPPHIHHREDEGFYVLDGEFSFLYVDRTFTATAGSFVHIPKGTLHTFNNVGAVPARVLVIITPAGFEELFEEIGEPVTDMSSPPPFNPATIERLLSLASKYHLEIKPPPGD